MSTASLLTTAFPAPALAFHSIAFSFMTHDSAYVATLKDFIARFSTESFHAAFYVLDFAATAVAELIYNFMTWRTSFKMTFHRTCVATLARS